MKCHDSVLFCFVKLRLVICFYLVDYTRAVCQFCIGDSETALDDCNKALDLDPNNIAARAVRARLLHVSASMCSQSGIGDELFPKELWTTPPLNGEDESVMWLREYPAVRRAIYQQQSVISESNTSKESVSRLIGSSIASAILFACAKDAIFGQWHVQIMP